MPPVSCLFSVVVPKIQCPPADSSRILFATWWLFIMIVTSFYTANLTAFLTFNGLQLPIKGVADLEKYSDVTWLASRDGAVVDIITVRDIEGMENRE
ncbi:Glutamate receptor 1 [Portunus trituberculatus]|uniref:Glutamate receptor 1 n=1 Tax=Portunus trituberculatus TaxID=210409 RepID=A0A5B7K593_PORTR|nr:Glutamate receptor 1 [Portunus trituberculatus]